MKTCKCGRKISNQYKQCWMCHQRELERLAWRAYEQKTEQEKEDELEQYYSTLCDMCGKEGALERSDGRCYCSTCWTIWNS